MRKKLKLDNSVNGGEVVEDNLTLLAKMEKEGRKAMAKWFIRAGINPNTIKIPSFAKFIQCLYPNLPLSVSQAEKEVLKVHGECNEKVKKFLKNFEGKLTLSYEWMVLADEWVRDYIKAPVLHEDFVCMTAHFIDDNWNIRKWILGYTTTDQTVPLEDIYIYPFRNAVQEFEIENKVSTLLLPNDEGFNEETLDAFRKLIEERGNNSINPPVFLIYCCADLFRLMVDDLFNDLSSWLLESVRTFVGWGKCCSSINWNLMFYQLQLAVDLRSEVAFSKDKIEKPSDDDEEWIKFRASCKLTGCIYKVAKELFEGGYSTSNVYFHLLAELKVMLNKELASAADNDHFIRKAKQILKRFDKYWNHMFLLLATAAILDPRFKMKYLEFYCLQNKVHNEGSDPETVLDYLRNLYAGYAASGIRPKPVCSVASIDSEEEEEEEEYDDNEGEGDGDYDEGEEEEEEEPDAYKDFVLFQEYLKFEGSLREFQESELDSYLKEPIMEWNKDFKALDWWREESQKYPILSRIARDILSIPISRATSYDAYAADKREPPEFVVSMEATLANAMMCTKSWLQL